MKILTTTRGKIPLLRKALEYATICQADPGTDDLDTVRRFKYAAGKNFNHVQNAVKETERRRENLARMFLTAPLVDLHEALLAAVTPLAAQGKDGPQVEDGDLPGFVNVIPGVGKEEELSAAVSKVEAEHAEAVALRAQLKTELDALMDEPVAVEIHTASWSALPSRLAGGTMAMIEFMLVDVPPDLAAVEVRPSVRAAIVEMSRVRDVLVHNQQLGDSGDLDREQRAVTIDHLATALLVLDAYESGRPMPVKSPGEPVLSLVADAAPANS